MSDIDIDELVAKHFRISDKLLSCYHIDQATRLARAVAERVKERARVCGRCSGAGWYQDDDDKSNTLGIKCPRCVRGVTFGGEA